MAIREPKKIRLDRLSYVHYQHPDLANAHRFLVDFGLELVSETEHRKYYKGFGTEPFIYVAEASTGSQKAFLGGAWAVESYEDLEVAAALPSASNIVDSDTPGGGSTVTLKDPTGHNVILVFGKKQLPVQAALREIELNSAQVKHRRGVFQRFKPGPSPIHKLGHYGLVVKRSTFLATRDWYTNTFNLKLTDSVFVPETGEDRTSFLHVEKGLEYTDHHVSLSSIFPLSFYKLVYDDGQR